MKNTWWQEGAIVLLFCVCVCDCVRACAIDIYDYVYTTDIDGALSLLVLPELLSVELFQLGSVCNHLHNL